MTRLKLSTLTYSRPIIIVTALVCLILIGATMIAVNHQQSNPSYDILSSTSGSNIRQSFWTSDQSHVPHESTPLFSVARGAEMDWHQTGHAETAAAKRVHFTTKDGVPNLIQFAEAKFPPHAKVDRHSHPTMTEVFHVKQGAAVFTFEDGERVLYESDTIAIKPNAPHSVTNNQPEELIMVYASIVSQ